jgi:hypothetical protein
MQGGRAKSLVGQTFGRLSVVRYAFTGSHRRAFWHCRCECGRECDVPSQSLLRGQSRSCGCLHLEAISTHGLSKTRLYRVWKEMHGRCYRPKNNRYALYGARGIIVCKRWHDLAAFVEDVGEPPTPTHQLERMDNDGNYEPLNCKWATPTEQARNRRNTIVVEYRGESRALAQWCDDLSLPYREMRRRIVDRDWTPTRAFETPLRIVNR